MIETITGGAADQLASWVEATTAVILGGVLLLAVRAAHHGRRAARSPLVVWQIMQLAVAKLTWETAWLPVGVVLGVLSVVVLVAVFWPGVLEEEPAAT